MVIQEPNGNIWIWPTKASKTIQQITANLKGTATIATTPQKASPNGMDSKAKNRYDFDPWLYILPKLTSASGWVGDHGLRKTPSNGSGWDWRWDWSTLCLSFLRSTGASQLVKLMAAVMARRRFKTSQFLPSRLTGTPMTATLSTVSRASEGWCDHQVSVLAMFSVRTFLLALTADRSLSHLVKARTAVVGMCWVSHGLAVEGQTNRLEGSNAGVGGGVGPVELIVHGGTLDRCIDRAGCRRNGSWWCGGTPRIFSYSLSQFCQLISELVDLMLGVWIGCSSWQPTVDDVCYLAYLVLLVLSNNFPSCRARLCETRSRSTRRLLSCVNSSVVKTTAAMSPVGIR